MKKLVALYLGDRYGVGPELVAGYLSKLGDTSDFSIAVVGDRRVLENGALSAGVTLQLPEVDGFDTVDGRPWALINQPFEAPVIPLGKMSELSGREMLNALAFLSEAAAQSQIDGIVYAPLNKQAMRLAGHAAGDELDFFIQHMRPRGDAAEINILDDLWTSRVTSHVPLREVGDLITIESVGRGIALIVDAFGIAGKSNPKIAVAALNPHAGEGGAYGREEIEVLEPAIAKARAEGLDIIGPLPSDTIFPRIEREKIDGVVTMFHDQGQIALKLMGLGKGITLLSGLPVPVATPGHGTAYDIAGQGIARGDGLTAALSLVAKMATSN